MERAFHVCIMYQKVIGEVSYADAIVTTSLGPFNPSFLDSIKKAVAEKRNVDLEMSKIVVVSMARLD